FGRFDTGDLAESALLLKQFITVDHPRTGLLIMMFLEMIHVVLSFIPAGLIAFASGMIYGVGWGMVINVIGTAFGTAISFYLSRLLGRRVVTLFVKDKDMKKVENLLAGDVSMLVLVVLFILPTPKDFFSYFMGLTNIKTWKYFTISALGRLPGMFVTTYLGAHILDRNYALLACSVAFMAVVMVLLVLFKNKILAMLKRKNP
ncbi:MAG: VTT domain-containing protein, partial [Oscillospiraceae bacterium]|nr:VTT domain-containing protein [Oscillospiraceae bacterium]